MWILLMGESEKFRRPMFTTGVFIVNYCFWVELRLPLSEIYIMMACIYHDGDHDKLQETTQRLDDRKATKK